MTELRLAFVVPGPPRGKERARRDPRSGRWYTPKRTAAFEQAIAWAATAARGRVERGDAGGGGIEWPLDARYEVVIRAVFMDGHRHDADNVAKAVLDALNRVLWADDTQVMHFSVDKAIDALRPRVEVEVRVLTEASTGTAGETAASKGAAA